MTLVTASSTQSLGAIEAKDGKNRILGHHTLLRLSAYSFLSPYIILMLTEGDFALYRASQFLWIALALGTTLLLWRRLPNSSLTFRIIFLVLVLNGAVSSFNNAVQYGVINLEVWLKISVLILMFLFFDKFRALGFSYFTRRFMPLAVFTVLFTALHFLTSPDIVFGRYYFFSLHPNLGGEILFSCLCFLPFLRSKMVFSFLALLTIGMIELLQSRSALVASVIFLSSFFFFSSRVFRRTRSSIIIVISCAAALIILILLVMWVTRTTSAEVIGYISEDILLINDPSRGIGTGLSGRDVTWEVAISSFEENVLFGAGLDQGGTTLAGARIHSGPVLLLAEFGLMSMLLIGVLVLGLIRAWRSDRFNLSIVLGSLFVFLFQARGLNLNLFPMIMWLACLPWSTSSLGRGNASQHDSSKGSQVYS